MSTNAHGTCIGLGGKEEEKKIKMKDRDGHCFFCSNLILTILLAKADILLKLVNSSMWSSGVVRLRAPGKFVIISFCDLKVSNDSNYKLR